MRLSPTALLRYESCPRQYWYAEVQHLRTRAVPAALAFGRVMHEAIAAFMHRPNTSAEDGADDFVRRWRAQLADSEIDYPVRFDSESLAATGAALMRQFIAGFGRWGLTALVDSDGAPIIERKLRLALGPGLVLSGIVDLVAMDSDARVLVLDWKTPAQASPAWFVEAADQLSAYQLLVEGNAETLGLPARVDRLGFVELIKRKVSTSGRGKGPEVNPPQLSDRRSDEVLADYREKHQRAVRLIERGDFPKRTGQAHASPCGLCEFRQHCLYGIEDDLIYRSDRAANDPGVGGNHATTEAV